MTDEKRAAIDADYFNKLTENNTDGQLFIKIMNDLNISPVMHKYVYEEELLGNSTCRKLKEAGFIKILDYDDFLTDVNIEDYQYNFKRAYQILNGIEFSGNVFTYCRKKESLGEIRSSLMSWYMNIDLFMTDDGGAKSFVVHRLNSRRHIIKVFNIYDTFVEISNLQTRSIKWSDIKGVLKSVFSKNTNRYDNLNNIWHSV